MRAEERRGENRGEERRGEQRRRRKDDMMMNVDVYSMLSVRVLQKHLLKCRGVEGSGGRWTVRKWSSCLQVRTGCGFDGLDFSDSGGMLWCAQVAIG
eukprot:750223-Hanusia_phi.AAC.1